MSENHGVRQVGTSKQADKQCSLISGIAVNFRFPWEKGPLRQLPDDEFQLPGSLEWPNAFWDVSTGMQFWIQTRKLAGWKINQRTLMGKMVRGDREAYEISGDLMDHVNWILGFFRIGAHTKSFQHLKHDSKQSFQQQ